MNNALTAHALSLVFRYAEPESFSMLERVLFAVLIALSLGGFFARRRL